MFVLYLCNFNMLLFTVDSTKTGFSNFAKMLSWLSADDTQSISATYSIDNRQILDHVSAYQVG